MIDVFVKHGELDQLRLLNSRFIPSSKNRNLGFIHPEQKCLTRPTTVSELSSSPKEIKHCSEDFYLNEVLTEGASQIAHLHTWSTMF